MIRLAICRGQFMKRFVEGADRGQSTLLPECRDEWVEESNTVRVVDSFVDALDLADLGFEGAEPAATGRPAYHPSVLLKLYIYGYLNRVQSSRRLEREAGRNLEVIWLLGRLVPDDKVRFPQGQWSGDPQGMRELRQSLSPDGSAGEGERRDRRQQVQSGEFARQQLHEGKDGTAPGADRGERCALSEPARHRRSPDSRRGGAVGGACGQDHA